MRFRASVYAAVAAVAVHAEAASAQAVDEQSGEETVLLEGIVVTPAMPRAAGPATGFPDGASSDLPAVAAEPASANPPPMEAQQQRFLRRPGAEVVVPVADREPGRLVNAGDVLATVPGLFVTERGAGSSAFISMRGSDIGSDGSRNGRGIRAYLDGFPVGRTEAGLTNQLLDVNAADYLEVYRGGNRRRAQFRIKKPVSQRPAPRSRCPAVASAISEPNSSMADRTGLSTGTFKDRG